MQNDKIHKRGRYTAEFKEKVALEALTGAKTHAQIASEYGISPDLVKDWKKQAKEMLGECFRRGGPGVDQRHYLHPDRTAQPLSVRCDGLG
ncbi:MAG: transposase [Akkermansia sp.]|nr:transposase [Akkermansia sp.]